MIMRTGVSIGVGIGALALALTMGAACAASAPNGARGLSHAPAGLVAAMAQSAEREAARDPAYRIDSRGCAQLSVQHVAACFAPGGARFRTPRAALQLRLTAWGRPGRLTALALAPSRPHANRIEYRGNGIRAWWRVLPLGYEQGFTVERAPAGHGPVVIELRASRIPAVRGNRLAWGTLQYGKLRVTDAAGRVLPATLTAVGRKVVLRFDAAHARYPLNVDPLVWVEQEVTASDGAANNDFGLSVALSGATALVGAPHHTVGGNTDQGAAYVYTEANGTWSQTAELTASDGTTNDRFGSVVALVGTTALVGAPYHKVGGNFSQGAAYVYTEANGTWSQTAELTASDGAANNYFGASVAVSGSTALVGAPSHTVGGNVGQGAAYVYTEANGAWSQTAELTASDGAANNDFGLSVALSGATALVGAPGHTVNGNVSQGAAYVYTETNGTWSQTAELTASDGATNNDFGSSVALSGATALVGAPYHTVGGNADRGAAYFFGSADLGLVLSTPAEVAPGADYTSQAILTNSSSTASPALSVLLPVPTGTNYVSSSATQGSCSQAAGTVTCNLGSLAASGGSTSGSVTLQATAAAGTALANSASLALSTPALSQTSTTTVAVTPAVTGLANASVTIGQNVPVESFTISGTGALTVTASSSNTTLLPNAGLNVSSGCNANGAKCTLSITPAVGQTGTATVTVTVMDVHGGQGSGSFTLTVSGLPPPPPSSGGGGALDCWSLLGLLLALLLPIRRRFRPGSNPAPS